MTKEIYVAQLGSDDPEPEPRPLILSEQFVPKALSPGRFDLGLSTGVLTYFSYTPGSHVLQRRGVLEWVLWRNPMQVLLIKIPDVALEAIAHELGGDRIELESTPNLNDTRVARLIEILEAGQAHTTASNRLLQDAFGQALSSVLVETRGVLRPPIRLYKGGLGPAQLKRLTGFIEAHLQTELSLDQLAEQVAISRSHLSKAFHRSTGSTLHQFVLQQRITRAKALLLNRSLRIIDVALACGFQTSQHFARVFRNYSGVTATAFRRGYATVD